MTPVARVLGRLARLNLGSSLLLRIQIALIVLVALSLVWGAAFYERERSTQAELREAEVRTAVQAHVFAEYSRSTVKRINELILDTRAQWRGDWGAFGELIARRQEFIGDIAFQVSVLDRDGMLAFSSLARPGDRADLSAREHFLVHSQGGNADRLFISRPVKGKVSGKWSLQFTRPILKDGVFDGVLVVSVSPELFGGFADKLRIAPASAIVVTRDSGEIMARYPAIESSYGMRLKSKPFTEPDAAVSGNYRYVARVDGAERIYGYYKLPEYGLVFVVGESITDILAPQAAHRLAIAKLAGGVSLFVLMLYLMLFGSLATLDKVRRQLESEKERADAANHAKSEFLAMMSHEIRTPLTSIMGFAQLLDAAGDGVRADAGQIILRNGQYLLDIINDILDISKVEAGRLQLEQVAFSPLETVRGIGAMMSAQAHSKGIAFHIDVAYPMPALVLADPTRWKQILFNLCGNAIKFTELGEVRLHLSYDAPRALLCCRVSDTGIGISPQQMAVLFQPFAQADRAIARQYGGTGLGLHLVQQLAEKMGGAVSARSTLGRGAVFDVSVAAKPVAGAALLEQAPAPAPKPVAAAPVQGLRGRVLLAEDGPDNSKLIGAFLSRIGLDHAVAENGAEALEQALRDDFDVILMDVQMPVLDGVGATRALRAAGCGVPIVALTANVMAEDVERYLAAGCTRWIGKPIDFDALAQCLAQLLPQSAPMPVATTAALTGEKLDGYAKICRAFAAGLPERLAQLQACIAAGQWDQAAELLHMLKGSAGSFGYPRVTDCAREMEQAIRGGQTQAAVQNLMDQLMMLDEVSQLYRREERQ